MKNYLLILALATSLMAQAQTDTLATAAGPVVLTPILHATMVLTWDGKTIFIDPYGGAERFADFPAPDLVVITHKHGDHFNPETLGKLNTVETTLIAPKSVTDELGDLPFAEVHPLENGADADLLGLNVLAVPMYNLPETADSRHPKGWGNGYVITIGEKRFYISGDTEDIEEMRQLEKIDYAFVCMNLPYTMTIEQAASAVSEFQPRVMYPFHYRGQGGFSDVEQFKKLVDAEDKAIEVRLRNWYPEK